MPDGPRRRGEGGGAYAYAPERHRAVFLFGRLRRWTRPRGRDLAHLTLRLLPEPILRPGRRAWRAGQTSIGTSHNGL
jgi:hypothetical protein